jgi:CelD/BcsL family acetyltransferase involved in cellulose biosynthesis
MEQGGEPVGFFPYQRVHKHVGRAVAWQMSDMHGVVLGPGVSIDAKILLSEVGLRAWHFDHVPAGQETFRRFFRSLDDSFYMDVSRGFDRYREERRRAGASLISQASRKSRKLTREAGRLRFEYHSEDERVFESLIGWKQQQLRRQGYFDTLCLPWVAPLMRRIAVAQSPYFAGVLSALFAGQTLVAVHLGVRSGPELCSWVPAYNADFAKYSPGAILHLELAKIASGEGIERIDLGRGQNPMKLSLQSGAAPVAIGSVERRPIRAVWTAGWYGARALAHSSPLFRAPLRAFRRARRVLAASSAEGRIATIRSYLERT